MVRRALAYLAGEARRTIGKPLGDIDESAVGGLLDALRDSPGGGLPFWTLRRMALEAALGDPRYGGNRDGWGWHLVGAVGDPQPRGFTAAQLANGTPARARAKPQTRWTATFASRSRARDDDADVCVVGLGAAGGVIAADLAEAGLRVIALEVDHV